MAQRVRARTETVAQKPQFDTFQLSGEKFVLEIKRHGFKLSAQVLARGGAPGARSCPKRSRVAVWRGFFLWIRWRQTFVVLWRYHTGSPKGTSPIPVRCLDLLGPSADLIQSCAVGSGERIFRRQDRFRLMQITPDRFDCLHGPLHRLACRFSTPDLRFGLRCQSQESELGCAGRRHVMAVTAKSSKTDEDIAVRSPNPSIIGR